MLFRSILSVFFIAQAVQSSPLMEKRTGEISCNPAKVNATEITLQLSPQGSLSPYPLYEKVSAKGQHQIAISNDKNSSTLSVIMRQCNSTRLGLSYSERYDPSSVNPVKLYLASDESKCIQRYGQIHSNDQSAKTHIIIDDCSNVDNQYQAKQFWSVYEPYALIYPLVVRNGKEDSLQLVLSGQDSGEVLATGQVPNGQNSYAFGFPQ